MKKDKIIFVTNTPSEYRIPLFQQLCVQYPVRLVFTRYHLAEKIYGNKIDKKKMSLINHTVINNGLKGYKELSNIIKQESVEGVVMPPMDSIIETLYSYWVYHCGRKYGKKVYYYWEKWEAPKDMQPLKKRIKNYVQRIISSHLFRKTDYCFGMGTKACEYFMKNGVEPQKCGITYNTSISPICELTSWRKDAGIPDGKEIIMYFGRVIEKKGLRFLIKAMSQLSDYEKEKTWLVVAGDGPDKNKLEEYAEQLCIQNISWLGYIHPDYRYDYFKQCDIFVLPTYHFQGSVEGWGLTINEAIQCGKLVIGTTAVGSAYDLITNENGRIVIPESSEEIANAIADLLKPGMKESAAIKDKELMELYNYKNSASTFIQQFVKVAR